WLGSETSNDDSKRRRSGPKQMPIVTRSYLTTAIVTAVALYLNPKLIVQQYEISRLVTNALYFGIWTCPLTTEEASDLSVGDRESCAWRLWRQSRGALGAAIVVLVLLWRGFYYACGGRGLLIVLSWFD
ncbi:hypothetical protein BHE74_00014503, partial [Ensete ventricosum]